MEDTQAEMDRALVLDGNAVAGLLDDIFGVDMTCSPTACVQCGREAELGALLAFTQAPGVVLRCATCAHLMIRIVQTPNAVYLDARGTMYLRLARHLS